MANLHPLSHAPRRLAAVLISAGSLLAGQACNDSANGAAPPDAAATASDVAAWCDALCDYSERCSEGGEAGERETPCREECPSELGGPGEAGLVQRRVAQAFAECFRNLSCAESDDSCSGQVVEQLDLDVESPLVSECLTVQDDCGGFSDDVCLYTVTATSAGMARLDECFSSGCEAVGECIGALTD